MAVASQSRVNVGGVLLDRPFKIRRLGHFGFFADDMEGCLPFYTDLLGFQVSDILDFSPRATSPGQLDGLGDPKGYFMRHGTDHHAFVLFPLKVRRALGRPGFPKDGVTVNQLTWQVGSLREVVEGERWLQEKGARIQRSGRDVPGSNWHTYPLDPEEVVNELYYGIEQIGWDGYSKPPALFDREFREIPSLPEVPEFEEIRQALDRKIDLASGYRYDQPLPAKYDVGGIMLPRPFKITRIGPVRMFVEDMDTTLAYYCDLLGFRLTEAVVWNGHRCVFLRINTEHHSLALYPMSLREELGLSSHTSCFSFGVQLNDYQQLRDAIAFLAEHGVRILHLPPELSPGIDYTAFAIDPDRHAIQLYYYMEQLGWDGSPRPVAERRKIDNDNWPEAIEQMSDTFMGEPFLGPWG